jgi:hypothetical protein
MSTLEDTKERASAAENLVQQLQTERMAASEVERLLSDARSELSAAAARETMLRDDLDRIRLEAASLSQRVGGLEADLMRSLEQLTLSDELNVRLRADIARLEASVARASEQVQFSSETELELRQQLASALTSLSDAEAGIDHQRRLSSDLESAVVGELQASQDVVTILQRNKQDGETALRHQLSETEERLAMCTQTLAQEMQASATLESDLRAQLLDCQTALAESESTTRIADEARKRQLFDEQVCVLLSLCRSYWGLTFCFPLYSSNSANLSSRSAIFRRTWMQLRPEQPS